MIYKKQIIELSLDNSRYEINLVGNLNNIVEKNKKILKCLEELNEKNLNNDINFFHLKTVLEELKNLEYLEREVIGFFKFEKCDKNVEIIIEDNNYMEEFYEKLKTQFNNYDLDKLSQFIIKDKIDKSLTLLKKIDNYLVKTVLPTGDIELSTKIKIYLIDLFENLCLTIFQIRGGLLYKKRVLSNTFGIYKESLVYLYAGNLRDKNVYYLYRRNEILFNKLNFILFLLNDINAKEYNKDLLKNLDKLTLYCLTFLKFKKILKNKIIEDDKDYIEEFNGKVKDFYEQKCIDICKKLFIFEEINNLKKKVKQLENKLKLKHCCVGKIDIMHVVELENIIREIIYSSFELRGYILYKNKS